MIRAAGYTMDGRKSWHFWAHLPLTPVHIGAVLRRGLASFTGEATEESWLFPVEGIHVVGAGITQHHDRVIRSQRKPSIVVTHQGNTLQVDGLLQLKITQVEPFDGAISTGISEIQALAIPGELQPTDVSLVGWMRIVEEGLPDPPMKMTLLPSGDQFGSVWFAASSGNRRCGVPPS